MLYRNTTGCLGLSKIKYMIELKLFTQEEKSIYDTFIATHGSWSLFQSWDWGEVQKSLHVAVERIGIFKQQKLICTAQIFCIQARRGTYTHIRQGPVFLPGHECDSAVWQLVLEYIKTTPLYKKALFIRANPMLERSNETESLMKSKGFKEAPIHAMDAQLCWVLPLNKNEDELLQGMRKTTRYLVRQAQKQAIRIVESNDIAAFSRLYKMTSSRHGFVQHSGIEVEYELFARENKALLLLGYAGNELLSAAIIIFHADQAIYHHGASISSKIPVSYVLQWEAIRRAKSRGCRIYNFWGIAPQDNPKHPWSGLTLFKQGFGGEPRSFMSAYDLPLSSLYVLPYTIDRLRKWRKGY